MQINVRNFFKALEHASKFTNVEYEDMRKYVWVWQEPDGAAHVASTTGSALYEAALTGSVGGNTCVWALDLKQVKLFLFMFKKAIGIIDFSQWAKECKVGAGDSVNVPESLPAWLAKFRDRVVLPDRIDVSSECVTQLPLDNFKKMAAIFHDKATQLIQYEFINITDLKSNVPFTAWRFTKESGDMVERLIIMCALNRE